MALDPDEPITESERASLLRENSDQEPDDDNQEQPTASRRNVLGGIAGVSLALTGWLAFAVERARAAVSGQVGTAASPYETAYVDRIVFIARTSDPSSPDNGTMWYNENA